MKKNKKLLALVCCMALLVGTVGATLAWLAAQTGEITNTFTVGKIEIAMDEVKVNEYGQFVDVEGNVVEYDKAERIAEGNNNYKLIPGTEYVKDPTVTVKAGSEQCYVFVEVTKSEGFDTYLEFSMNDEKWTKLNNNVFYRLVGNENEVLADDEVLPVIKGNKITVRDTLTQTALKVLDEKNYPNVTFKAYAVQAANLDVNVAWTQAKNEANYN